MSQGMFAELERVLAEVGVKKADRATKEAEFKAADEAYKKTVEDSRRLYQQMQEVLSPILGTTQPNHFRP